MPYGYVINIGYMGWVESQHRYVLFDTEEEYLEYIEEKAK